MHLSPPILPSKPVTPLNRLQSSIRFESVSTIRYNTDTIRCRGLAPWSCTFVDMQPAPRRGQMFVDRQRSHVVRVVGVPCLWIGLRARYPINTALPAMNIGPPDGGRAHAGGVLSIPTGLGAARKRGPTNIQLLRGWALLANGYYKHSTPTGLGAARKRSSQASAVVKRSPAYLIYVAFTSRLRLSLRSLLHPV